MKRVLLMLAAMPFVIVGGVAAIVGVGLLTVACLLWPFPMPAEVSRVMEERTW